MIRIGSNKLRRTSARRDLWSIDQPIATQITIVILVESYVEEILESDLTLPSASIPPSSSDAVVRYARTALTNVGCYFVEKHYVTIWVISPCKCTWYIHNLRVQTFFSNFRQTLFLERVWKSIHSPIKIFGQKDNEPRIGENECYKDACGAAGGKQADAHVVAE